MSQPYQPYGTPTYGAPVAEPQGGLATFIGSEQTLWLVVAIAVGVAVGILFMVWLVRQFLYIARPNEALIFSGKSYQSPDGTMLGYRVVTQGRRAFRIPVLERVDSMDMRLVPIDVVVQNAYSMGNIPLQIHAIANVKINGNERLLPNAIERFLGRSTGEIQIVAQQTLEGALREVLARMTPEEVNEDRLKFAENLAHAAEADFDKLGLQLDTLKIQNVADETGYLDSLGRPRIAGALRDAENSENQAMQETAQAQATAQRRAEVAKEIGETAVAQKRNEVRRIMAELDGNATAVEREAEAAAKTARAEAEKDLQAIRNELEQRRLMADVIIPAEIDRQARSIIAKGEAAPTLENGAAQVEVLRAMSDAWITMGDKAKELYVIQHLDEIVGTVVAQMSSIQIGEVNVIDQGDGRGLASYAASYPQMVAAVLHSLRETTGVDVTAILDADGSRALAAKGGA